MIDRIRARREEAGAPRARLRLRVLAALLAGALLAPVIAAAQGGDGPPRQTATSVLKDRRPGETTATKTVIDYFDPQDREGKPPPVRRVKITDPRGTEIDTSVPARCGASEAELMSTGADACRRGSRVGSGFLRLDTGVPGPERFIEADIVLLNERDQLIFLSTIRGSGARVVTRAQVRGRSIITEVPLLPGTPPDGASLDLARTRLAAIEKGRGSGSESYIRTPRRCPRRGFWVVNHKFTYEDGVTQSVASRTACRSRR